MHGEPAVKKTLPPRPHLDHLKGQAKSLLAEFQADKPAAIAAIAKYLPAAKEKTAKSIKQMKLRLADAQSVVARQNGFASWPHLVHHIEQLRALEGRWDFDSLEVDGTKMPAEMLKHSCILIDGDRFRTESLEGIYEGIISIDVEREPHAIDIEFIAGPEAGNTNYGIFRLEGDQMELCLDLNGKARPTTFCTSAGSGHAFEKLKRASHARPKNVSGGTPVERPTSPAAQECVGFAYIESSTLTCLQGEWTAVRLIRDGQEVPGAMLPTGRRSAQKNEVKITFGGQMILHTLVRIDESKDPIQVEYYHLSGMMKGTLQAGIMKWEGDEVCFNMALTGQARPVDFTCAAGSGQVFSQWRRKK
jgi:uncharacterized protein (TIGR03067 family)